MTGVYGKGMKCLAFFVTVSMYLMHWSLEPVEEL